MVRLQDRARKEVRAFHQSSAVLGLVQAGRQADISSPSVRVSVCMHVCMSACLQVIDHQCRRWLNGHV